ncbi:MAG: phosphatase PAP2 family protein [Thermoleophilaceae bacterium]|nr:phosphatase PAP2 family protein [Thermoleophilaceae bacterium]
MAVSASADATVSERPSRRSMVAGPVVGLITLIGALVATQVANVPLRDPDGVVGRRLGGVVALVLGLVFLDIAVRAARRTGTKRPSLAAMRAVRRERWHWHRGVAVGSAVISFYISYLAYRNIKSMVPLLRPGDLFDRELADFDRVLFAGNDPAALLHSLLGVGVQTQLLSVVYLLYLAFVPLSLALALVYSRNLQGGLFFTTAMSINWTLGAASYLLLPALGPIYVTPVEFAHLPTSGASDLQSLLLDQRIEFLSDPAVTGAAQSIAAFASLHVSMLFTVAVAAHLLGLARNVRIALWALVAVSAISTIYLGWHYVIDDVAGVVIALGALAIARVLTGFDLTAGRQSRDAGAARAGGRAGRGASAALEP